MTNTNSTDAKSTLNPAQAADPTVVVLSPEEVVQQLRMLRAQMSLLDPEPGRSALRRRLAHVNADFVLAAINAVGTSDVVQSALGRTDEELRQESAVNARWTAVADELRALLQSVLMANTVRRQRLGLAALQTYQICVQLAREEGHATRLNAHIAEMKRLNRFGRTSRKTPSSPTPAPAPIQL
jgi:hypothetical protein